MTDIVSKSFGNFHKSSDSKGNMFKGDELSPQCTRIALREHFKLNPDSQIDPTKATVIFTVLAYMGLFFCKNGKFNSYLLYLRKIAIDQTSMEVMTSKGIYDGNGLYLNWKDGKRLPMHYSSPKDHTSLYNNLSINPLRLSLPFWWAFQMSMLGLYDEQSSVYKDALSLLGINSEEEFLNYMIRTYSPWIDGNTEVLEIKEYVSNIYFEKFPYDIILWKLNNHGNCKTGCCFSEEELSQLSNNTNNFRCLFCNVNLSVTDDLTQILNRNPSDLYEEYSQRVKPLKVMEGCPSMITEEELIQKEEEIVQTTPLSRNNSIQNSARHISHNRNYGRSRRNRSRCIIITFKGPTGAGKTSARLKFVSFFQENRIPFCVINSDELNQKGLNVYQHINKQLFEFQNVDGPIKVVINDMCNERGRQNSICGYKFFDNKWEFFDFCPNMNPDNFSGFQKWCLRNLLERNLSTETTNFWLNMHSIGLKKLLSVHNSKCQAIYNSCSIKGPLIKFNEDANLEEIREFITPDADAYLDYLNKELKLDEEIQNLLSSIL